jgi:hypothetical protein
MKEERFHSFVNRLSPLFVYKITQEFGADATDILIKGYYEKAITGLKINTPMVKRHTTALANAAREEDAITHKIFTTTGPIRYACCFNPREWSSAKLGKMIRRAEVVQRMTRYMGSDRKRWLELINKHEEDLPALIGTLEWFNTGRVEYRHDTARNQLYESVFEETSKTVHEMSRTGFSFSPSLFLAYTCILESPGSTSRGRPRERPLLLHLCENREMKNKVITRPVNDVANPKFLCRGCGEKINKSQKTFYKLHRLGKKVM